VNTDANPKSYPNPTLTPLLNWLESAMWILGIHTGGFHSHGDGVFRYQVWDIGGGMRGRMATTVRGWGSKIADWLVLPGMRNAYFSVANARGPGKRWCAYLCCLPLVLGIVSRRAKLRVSLERA